MCNFTAVQRREEIAIIEFALAKLGIKPIGRVGARISLDGCFISPNNSLTESDASIRDDQEQRTTMEGGDFVILTENTAALGVGLRTNYAAALYLM